MIAGLLACFFFTSLSADVKVNSWKFDPETESIYKLIINLQTEEALQRLEKFNSKQQEHYKFYLQSLAETLEILITENVAKFEIVEKNFKTRLKSLEAEAETAETLFLRAEISLQRGFCYINLNQELNAVLSIRQAYNLVQECLKKYPAFVPVRKTSGVIQVMVGTVPDKYHWFMSLLGMKGSVKTGQKQLNELRSSEISLSSEATILYFTIKGFINQQFEESSKGFKDLLLKDPDNRLLLFITVNMMMKNSQSEDALQLIHNLDIHNSGLSMVYIEYLRGEIHLQRTEYQQAINAYQTFISSYKSESFKKDANLKIALSYYLMNKIALAKQFWEKAKNIGKAVAEPDVYASHLLAENQFPNEKILKVRFFTDGGYYKEAKAMLATISPANLRNHKEQTEYYYRKARLAHKTGDITAAKLFYQQSIDMTGENPWYFGANSALQLGYIYQAHGEFALAKESFEKALSYKKHEYKNSVDGKAKSALDQLPKS